MSNRLMQKARPAGEAGQTSADYVAITALALIVAIGITWLTLSATLSDAIGVVGNELVAFADNIVP